jgi:ATP-binding cassette subfamily A (ABC1) protein 3
MTIQIPVEYAQKFGSFFKSFDKDLDQLNVMSYGISISTLEEVFLKVGSLKSPGEATKKPLRDVNELDDLEDGKVRDGTAMIDQMFNMKDNVSELDNSFLNNLKAILYKRYNGYRRNKKGLITEVVVPALFMIAGIALTKRARNWQSVSRIQTPDRLPLPQALLFNPNAVIPSSDVSMVDLVRNLPSDAFEVKYSAWNQTANNRN